MFYDLFIIYNYHNILMSRAARPGSPGRKVATRPNPWAA